MDINPKKMASQDIVTGTAAEKAPLRNNLMNAAINESQEELIASKDPQRKAAGNKKKYDQFSGDDERGFE